MKAITVHNLSKQYQRSGEAGSYLALRDVVSNAVRKKKTHRKSFLALQDVNFVGSPGTELEFAL